MLFLCLGNQISAQNGVVKIPDTLQLKDYDYLFDRIEQLESDSIKQSLYLKSFLFKAKKEKNFEEIINGYKNYVHYSSDKLKLVYADSMIYNGKLSKENSLIGSAYLTKGIVYYSLKRLQQALDNYLVANEYVSKTNDKYLNYKIKYNIGLIKYYLGFYNEAVSLFRECIIYFKNEDARGYLNSIHSLGLCYNKIQNYGLSSDTNRKGLAEGRRLGNKEMESYFIHSEGINQYTKKNYRDAIKKINSSLPIIKRNKDFANEAIGYFYIGKSYWQLNENEIALPYFEKVVQIIDSKNYVRPDLRENYELMISYYKSKDNLKSQLYYIRKLLILDNILDSRYQYLTERIHKEYDTKKLLQEKKHIENLLNNRKYNDLILGLVIACLFTSLIFLFYRYRRNKRIYRQKYEELMEKKKAPKVDVNTVKSGVADINRETVIELLKQLEKFEKDKKFLEKDLTSNKLATTFGSNVKYLSKIIYHYRGKKLVNYINDLKVDYLISLLQEDKKLRNYTNKALAEEVGFSSTQRFANAFFARTGMPTSFFIEELKKEITTGLDEKNETNFDLKTMCRDNDYVDYKKQM
ncbi:helix-turn-helix domain-containing protein [Flavobacterium sp. Fl-318]|uniref:Helix-turn-helix domain-containing protein n=1 Tax=Flavobacterium cupriresistens TaxID=2893885 RepID=A0ABU4R5P8_9FLAO|nr:MULTISPECIES: helix-turn-helix domain-containing protein [unclassified Flavobacterium]MDX6187838.1 helix-turn-helix domain-containing protein [Flavobacterium sp. Fl-318]UFH42241.1 helix-turn-helix domain-containing protein [Flavobacterium sp. F-323]